MNNGCTPLYVACQNGHVDAARLLLDRGAEVDRATEDGRTPLYIACSTATSTRRACCWTKARRSTGRRRTVGRRCTSPASRAADAARLLLDNGAAVDRARRTAGRRCTSPARTATSTRRGCCWTKARRSIGRWRTAISPLYIACAGPRRRGALLLEKGAEVDRAAKKDGSTPLHAACENGHVDAARLLLGDAAGVVLLRQGRGRSAERPRRRGTRLPVRTRTHAGGGRKKRTVRHAEAPSKVLRARATSTRRGCCWTTAPRSTRRWRTVRRRRVCCVRERTARRA